MQIFVCKIFLANLSEYVHRLTFIPSVEQTTAVDLTVCSRGWFSQCFGVWLSVGRDEADEFVEIGALNGIFVLGRSMGFIGESEALPLVHAPS